MDETFQADRFVDWSGDLIADLSSQPNLLEHASAILVAKTWSAPRFTRDECHHPAW
jgi:hypothetical protein